MKKKSLKLNRRWFKVCFGDLGSALSRGFSHALDRRATGRLLGASLACTAVSAALRRAISMGKSDRSGFGAACAEIEALRGSAMNPEEQFIVDCVLCALGDATRSSKLADEPLALHSRLWRQTRRRLRRFGAALRTSAPLGANGTDALAEMGALLDRMRQEGWTGVGWPNAGALARDERDKLDAFLGQAQSEQKTRRI